MLSNIAGPTFGVDNLPINMSYRSAYTGHATLRLSGNGRPWLSWQLKNCRLLTLSQRCQEHHVAVRKFQRIVMDGELVLIDLPKDRRLLFDRIVPRPQFSSYALNLVSES